MLLPTGAAFRSTVSVSLLIGGRLTGSAAPFLDPIVPGYENITSVPSHAFFIEHQNLSTNATGRVLFDLGPRKDFENLSPAAHVLTDTIQIDVEKDVATQLKEGGIDLNTVEAIIWSHSHFDHIGDPATFPNTTQLVFGPGTTAKFLPGYPTNPDSPLLDSDFANRTVTEINFDSTNITIAGFRAHDYFQDGSFYLLDVPGHITGHMAALARVTISPPSFVYLGGDTCHHPGQIRPSPNFVNNFPCPASIIATDPISPEYFGGKIGADLSKRTTPLLELHALPPPSIYEDPVTARISAGKMADSLDASEDVFVVLAHDSSFVYANTTSSEGNLTTNERFVKLFPETMNAWKKEGWKNQHTVWSFVERDNAAYRFRPKNNSEILSA